MAGSGLFISYLGTFAVHLDGRALALPRGVTTRLLALLAIHAGRVVRDSTIVDALWDDDRAPRSMGALRNAAMRLRESLGGAASAVVRVGDGYRLDGADIDADVFERSVEAAHTVDANGDSGVARAAIEHALGLVRGAPLDEVSDEPWARHAVDRWTERIAAAEDHHGTLMANEPSSDDIATLRGYADRRPEREVRWVNLIRALDGVGRRADALRAYRHAVRALAELGLSPSPELRQAEAATLAADTMLAHPDSAAAECVGREQLLADVVDSLAGHRVVNLVGLGGVGKTRLAIEVATAFCDAHGDRLVEVDLTDVDDATSLLVALGDSAGLSMGAHSGMDAFDSFVVATASTTMLMVLDNAEHVAGAVAELVTAVVARCPTVRVLLTAREALEFPGEHAIVVPPLPTPALSLEPAACAANPSVRLLSARRRPADTDPLVAARIARAVGGLPLGLELAAGLSRHVPLGDVADGLEAEFVALDLHHPGLRPRQRLDAVFRYAIARLADEDRDALGSLSVLGAPFTAATAAALIAGERDGPCVTTPVAGLARLVAATLLALEPGSVPTYRLLPLQRAAARDLLDAAGRVAAEDRADSWYRRLAADLGPQLRTPEQGHALAALRAELRNVRATIVHLAHRGQASAALRVVSDLGDFWALTQQQAECARLTTMALDASDGTDSPASDGDRARALFTVAAASASFRELLQHEAAARAAFDLSSAVGDARLRGRAQVLVATIEAWSGRFGEAVALLTDVLAGDDDTAGTHALDLLGYGAFAAGDHADGLRRFAEVAQRWHEAGDRFSEARSAMRSGMLLVHHGVLDEAEASLRRAVDLAGHELPNVEIHAHHGLALIALEQGDRGAAETLVGLASRFLLAGDLGCSCSCNRSLAELAREAGDDDEALRLLRQNLSLLRRFNAQDAAASLVQIAEIYQSHGAPSDAARLAAAARSMSSGSGMGWTRAQWDRLAGLESATAAAAPVNPVDVGDAVRLALRR